MSKSDINILAQYDQALSSACWLLVVHSPEHKGKSWTELKEQMLDGTWERPKDNLWDKEVNNEHTNQRRMA